MKRTFVNQANTPNPDTVGGVDVHSLDIPYLKTFTIPVETLSTNPYTTSIVLPKCKTAYLWLNFPDGCDGLAGVQLWRYARQIFPRPENEWMIANNLTPRIRFVEILETEPFSIEIRAYNLDDTFTHTLWVMLEVEALDEPINADKQSFLKLFSGR